MKMATLIKRRGGVIRLVLMLAYMLVASTLAQIALATHEGSGLESSTGRQIERDEHTASGASGAEVSGIIIGTYQTSDRSSVNGNDVKDEFNGQLFLNADLPLGPGGFHLEIRGGTSPRSQGVTSVFGEANDSVGETLDQDGNGRLVVTQLFYGIDLGRHLFSAGLLESTSHLDANSIADDEYTQFIGSPFVNNPVIEYPSFALAGSYGFRFNDELTWFSYLSSTNGLEDEGDPTYDNVFHPGRDDKGIFAATELQWSHNRLAGNLALWLNTDDHDTLDGGSGNKDNYGAYASIEGPLSAGQWNVWLGGARESVSAADTFIGVAYAYPYRRFTFGAAVARTGVSDDQPGSRAASVQAEAYVRFNLIGGLHITPDIQYLNDSGLDPDNGDTWLFALRMGLEF